VLIIGSKSFVVKTHLAGFDLCVQYMRYYPWFKVQPLKSNHKAVQYSLLKPWKCSSYFPIAAAPFLLYYAALCVAESLPSLPVALVGGVTRVLRRTSGRHTKIAMITYSSTLHFSRITPLSVCGVRYIWAYTGALLANGDTKGGGNHLTPVITVFPYPQKKYSCRICSPSLKSLGFSGLIEFFTPSWIKFKKHLVVALRV